MRHLFLVLISTIGIIACAQPRRPAIEPPAPIVSRHVFQLGLTWITVQESRYGTDSSMVLLNLHHNEQTAKEAAHLFAAQRGGRVISIENDSQRFIEFSQGGRKHMFDPNRMFSLNGISKSLKLFHSYTPQAAKTIEAFASFVLEKIPRQSFVVAVHNNRNGDYSVLDYLAGGELRKDAKATHVNPDMDSDNFIYTTDAALYRKLRQQNINVVLQKNDEVSDDGSLSVFFGKKGKRYANVEAEHQQLEAQLELLEALALAVKEAD